MGIKEELREATNNEFLSRHYFFIPTNHQKLQEPLLTCQQHHSRFQYGRHRCSIQSLFRDQLSIYTDKTGPPTVLSSDHSRPQSHFHPVTR